MRKFISIVLAISTAFFASMPAQATDKGWFRQVAQEVCKRYRRGESPDVETVTMATAAVSIRNPERAERAVRYMDDTELGLELLRQTGQICPQFNDDYLRPFLMEQY